MNDTDCQVMFLVIRVAFKWFNSNVMRNFIHIFRKLNYLVENS